VCVNALKVLMVSRPSLAQPRFTCQPIDSDKDDEQFRRCDELPKHLDGLNVADTIDDQGLPGFPINLPEDCTTELLPALVNEGGPDFLQHFPGTIETLAPRHMPNIVPETDA
jgi:hypothetical protein